MSRHRYPLGSLGWRLVGVLLIAAPAGASAGSIEVSVAQCPGCPEAKALKAEVALRPTDGGSEVPGLSKTIEVPGQARFEVPEGRTWEASASAAGYWSRPVVAAQTQPGPLRLELWPAGRIEGEVRAAQGASLPDSMTVRFQPAPGAAKGLPRASASCPVVDRRFRCELPAGVLDLRLRARGYITQYRWGLQVPARRSLDLGSVELRPGTSIVGWVEVPAGERLEDCRVEIEPRVAGSATSLADEERRGWLRRASVNSRGFFDLDGIAPGSYLLTVRHPRLAPATVGPMGVLTGSETELAPIPLHPPAAVEVRFHPASDPYGSHWTASLHREASTPGVSEEVARSTASSQGVWRAAGLSPGTYTLDVEGSHNARWADETLEVTNGMAPVELELPVVEVEGEVRLGKEPLAALLWFGGEHGARRIAARSSVSGAFTVVLPRQDEGWLVEVYNQPRAIAARFFDVSIRKSADQRVARVRFEVPDTLVKGVVVDDDDRPVPGAFVDAFGTAGGLDHAKTRSSSDPAGDPGRFEFRGLRPGTWQLTADAAGGDKDLASDALRVEVAQDQPTEEVRLVLHRRLVVTGQVVGPSGQPLAGADVVAVPELASGTYVGWQPHATADSAGTFTLRLPGDTVAAELTLLAPGFAMRQLRIDPRRSDPLILPVDQVAGTLVLVYPEAEAKGDPPPVVRRLLTTVFHDFRIPADLTNWAHLHGVGQEDPGRFVIPLLEPGRYTACRKAEPAAPGAEEAAALAGSCASGELGAYGALTLRLPKPSQGNASPSAGRP